MHDEGVGRRWGPRTAVVCAVLAPVLVLAGAAVAAAVQPPGYDPVRQTFSALANGAATDAWIMGSTLLVLGLAYLLVAAGLPGLVGRARLALVVGGVAVALAALFPQPAIGSSPWHMTAATVGWLAFLCFPLAAARRDGIPPVRGRAPAWVVTAVLVVLMLWFGAELIFGGPRLGLAQRILVVAQTVWPAVIGVVSYRERPPRPLPADEGRPAW